MASPLLPTAPPEIDPLLTPDIGESEAVEPSDEEIESAISTICDTFEEEDRPTWDTLTRECRRLILMWHGFQKVAWNEVARDWRTPEQMAAEGFSIDPDEYNENINIYKAYGESLIAAASASIPKVRFFPRDANNPEDIVTAKEHSKASDLIQQNNSVKLLLLKGNYIRFNSYYVAFYNYHHESEDYGMTRTPITGSVEKPVTEETCPTCGKPITEEDVKNDDGTVNCVYCGETVIPVSNETTQQVPSIVGYDEEPKGREVIEVYSPLHVKIAPYVRKLRDSPYLRLETEQHYTKLRDLYPEIAKDISPSPDTGLSYRWSRENPYQSGPQIGINTVKRWWLRPFSYNVLSLEDPILEYLKNTYPNGIHAVFIEDKLAEIKHEDLDQHWTITEAPTAETIIADPLGSPLAPIQRMKNDIINLAIETIDHGIGETFADPNVLHFDNYRNTPASPGLIFPAVPPIGKGLADGFHQLKTATLSKEVMEVDNKLTEDGQLSVGAFPSIFGGFAQGGSKTFGEYNASKNQALQRLTIPWEEINAAWAKVMKKAVISMKESMKGDEVRVKPSGNSFENVNISKDSMQGGEIGEVDTENSDQFPTSWPEKRDLLMQLLGFKDPTVNAAIFDPTNTGEVAKTIGFTNFNIPGEQDRNKQLWEISELLKEQPGKPDPMLMPGMPGFGIPKPSIAAEEVVDEHIVHIQVIRNWAISEAGMEAKKSNTSGYQNVMAHLMQHISYATPPKGMNPDGSPSGSPDGNPSGGNPNKKPGEPSSPPPPPQGM